MKAKRIFNFARDAVNLLALAQTLGMVNSNMTPGNTVSSATARSTFQRILQYLTTAGGPQGSIYASYLRSLHAALGRIHVIYAEQLCQNFCSGLTDQTAMPYMEELFRNIHHQNDNVTKWAFVSTSPSAIVQQAIGLAREIEISIGQRSDDSDAIIESIAYSLTQSNVLPGNAATRLQGSLCSWLSDFATVLNEEFQDSNQRGGETAAKTTTRVPAERSDKGGRTSWYEGIKQWLKPETPLKAFRLCIIFLVIILTLGSITAPGKNAEELEKEDPIPRWMDAIEKHSEEFGESLKNAFKPSYLRERELEEKRSRSEQPQQSKP
jgi:hypothetical protein